MATPRPDLAEAVGALLKADPARVAALAAELRAPNRLIESTVEGRSMGPGLPAGSRIRIELAERTEYAVGEVVAFLADGQVVVHRVVHLGRSRSLAGLILTRGDVMIVPDPPLAPARVLGRVVGVRVGEVWRPVGGPTPRRLPARAAARLAQWVTRATLRLGPAWTSAVLGLLRRCEGALRWARARRATRPR